MTSRNLCFKLMKEDLKRRTWTLAITILGLLFSILVPVALKCSEYAERYGADPMAPVSSAQYRQIENIINLAGVNGFAIFILIILSLLWAASGFQYLHNSRKVDFYHSIPVKRHLLFFSRYANGILVPAAVYLLFQVCAAALILRSGIPAYELGDIWWRAWVMNMVYYSMLYTTAAAAMMLTGNLVVGILGTGVFYGYGPMAAALVFGYLDNWFETFYMTREANDLLYRIVQYSSPFANYMYAVTDLGEGLWNFPQAAGAAAVTAALAMAVYGLYRIRPSEAARKAMAFPRTCMPIKVLLVIPAAEVFGMFFYLLRPTTVWLLFGTVCGAVLMHCVMEIIYHFDFRKLFAHRICLGLCTAFAVLLSLAGRYDWYGYDSWVPDAADVESASVQLGYGDDWVTYGSLEKRKDYNGEEYYGWDYGWGQTEYIFDHMQITDLYPVLELAENGAAAARRMRSQAEFYEESGYDGMRYVVQYRMTNGSRKTRTYVVVMDEAAQEALASVHDNLEYKTGIYPLLQQESGDLASVYFQQYNRSKPVKLDRDGMEHLLQAYQADLMEQTLESRRKELPLGTIQFRTVQMEEAMKWNQAEHPYEGLEDRCYYPVYPSFARTLEALEEAGISPKLMNEDIIESVAVYHYAVYGEDGTYDDSSDTAWNAVYKEPAMIRELAPALCSTAYLSMNPYYEIVRSGGTDVTVTMKQEADEAEPRVISCELDLNRISEETAETYQLHPVS